MLVEDHAAIKQRLVGVAHPALGNAVNCGADVTAGVRPPPAVRHGNAIKAGGKATAGLVGRRVRSALRRREKPRPGWGSERGR
jgi:hypothetical protein